MRPAVSLMACMAVMMAGCDPDALRENASAGAKHDAGAKMDRGTKFGMYAVLMSEEESLSALDPVADLRRYERLNIPQAKPDVEVTLFPRSIEQTLSDLKQARRQAGDLKRLDEEAGRVLPALERLLTRVRSLDSYYTTRGPLADNLERGRKEHPLLLADYRAVITAWKPLREAYEAARDETLVDAADFYRREGRAVDYYDVTIVQKAAVLARTIDSPEAARDPARIALADRTVAELLTLIQRGRAARTARVESPDSRSSDRGVPESIEQMIGGWRNLKRSPDADHYEKMKRPFATAMQAVVST